MSVYHSENVSRWRGPTASYKRPRSRWQDWTNLIVGIWLIISPWFMAQIGGFEYANPGIATNMLGLGVALIAMCVWALARPAAAVPEWIGVVCGAWLVVTPWALGFVGAMPRASIVDGITGAVVLLIAISAARHTRRALS